MALPAGGLCKLGRQDWLLPCQRAVVCFRDSGGWTLPAMAHDATKLFRIVRYDGMSAEWLRFNVGKGDFLLCHMTSVTAIHDSNIRQPNLLNAGLKMPLQSHGVATCPNQGEIPLLVVPPLAEVVLGRCYA